MSYWGILGMNARNLKYIRPNNKKDAVKIVDDKLATKKLLQSHDLPTPKLYGSIESIRQFDEFNFNSLPQNFVVKPNRGFGGGGIVVLKSKDKKEIFQKKKVEKREWVGHDGEVYSFEDLKAHIVDILDGKFSLSNVPDIALLERKIVADKKLTEVCGQGVPDVRVIVYNQVPVMAMLRLPTMKSKGKANMYAGAVGVGIDMAEGVTTTASIKKPKRQLINEHPDTNQNLIGFEVPYWDEILAMSIESQLISKIGYLGVDVVIDRKNGAQILELNARPGLEIQMVNLDGLARRLERVEGLQVKTVEKGVRIASELFGGDIERKVESVVGVDVVGSVEEIEMLDKKGKKRHKYYAKIDTGADSTSIDEEVAIKLGYGDVVERMRQLEIPKNATQKEIAKIQKRIRKELQKEKTAIEDVYIIKSSNGVDIRPYIKVVYYLGDKKKVSVVNIANRETLQHKIIIGRKDLEGHLVDPGRNVGLGKKK